MSVLSKYLCREFFKLLLICLSIFVSMYLIIHFFGRLDNFAHARVPISRMVPFLLYKIPYIIVQMLPPASLISVIILFSLMKKNNEIMALKASGMSALKLAQPILTTSLLLSAALFVFSEVVVPYTSSKSNEIWRIEVRKRKAGSYLGRSHIWYRGENCIYWIKRFENAKGLMHDPVFYFFDSSFRLTRKIDGRLAHWKDGIWVVRDGLLLERKKDGRYGASRFDAIDLRLPETPQTFVREEVKPEEMGYWELQQFARRLQRDGYNATRYFVDLEIKVSFCFVVFCMALVGIPVALNLKKGGAPLAVSIGVMLCFIYLVIIGVSRSLGIGGFLPPLLSAWLANGVFFFLGVYWMMHSN
ncbi:MAG: LPS export ABC transporter permease LptG [Deltaproteobacteria bacterium]|nr:MAG: LPS export ABC transporter permease LptG [Deltaproteobacteria bacterium]